ncbi:MAG TPA: sulfatase-like hydrolase/transferase [Planctomycetota bacterium]
MSAGRGADPRSWFCAVAAAAVALVEGAGLGEPAGRTIAAAWLYGGGGLLGGALLAVALRALGRAPRSRLPWRLPVVAASVAALASLAVWWWPPERGEAAAGAPDVLLITCDTTRADRWWAIADAEAPGAALEDGAFVFATAYATTGLTAPAHASILTGLHPHQHGLHNNGGRLPRLPGMAESLRAEGWTTLAVPSVIHLDPGFGFAQGFDRHVQVEDGLAGWMRPLQAFALVRRALRVVGGGRAVRSGIETLAAATDLWRSEAGNRPRFLWVHVYDPHWPYEPAPADLGVADSLPPWPAVPVPGWDEQDVAGWRRAYDGELVGTRRRLREFVAGLRAEAAAGSRRLWVIGLADHGEAFGEHGAVDHGDLLYEEQLRVPFWIDAGGASDAILRDVRSDLPASQVDVFPTLMALLGLPLPAGLPGRSLRPAMRGETQPLAPVFAQTRLRTFDNAMVRLGSWKTVRNLRFAPNVFGNKPGRERRSAPEDLAWMILGGERYSIAADPFELEPLAEPPPGLADALSAALEDWLRERGPPPPEGALRQNLSPDVVQALRELGYF